MDRRLEFHEILANILGSRNVYFQPPESKRMSYPCIRYERDDIQNDFADNNVYRQKIAYSVTVIDEDPDSEIVFDVSKLPTARFERHYVADNLNHDVFHIFY